MPIDGILKTPIVHPVFSFSSMKFLSRKTNRKKELFFSFLNVYSFFLSVFCSSTYLVTIRFGQEEKPRKKIPSKKN